MPPALPEKTDYTRWRLLNEDGRHTWHYLEDDESARKWPQTLADKYYLGLPLNLPDLPQPKSPLETVQNGLTFFSKLQLSAGNWGCEYGGPMFLLPCIVFAWTATATPIPGPYAAEIKNYLFARANPVDGGWGLHIEGESTLFGTSLNYTVLRLLGVPADHAVMIKARTLLHKHGGAVYAPHWAKFWLALLGIADWDIVNPVPPEAWLLPDWVPVAPWRWWIHIRQVFLPMSFIWSRRWTMPETEVIRSLRNELFTQDWGTIDWKGNRNSIADIDNHHPKTWVLGSVNWLFSEVWMPFLRPRFVATWAEDWVSKLVDMEDENSDYADLASVNGPLNMVVCFIRDGGDAYSVRRHRERLEDFLWVNKEGMLVNGTNGVQCWDTAFLVQAVHAASLAESEEWRPMLVRALEFLDRQQMRENCKDQEICYRHPRKGAWGFSNKDQGYAVCDCISEALKSVILLQKTPGYPQLLDDQRIFDAVDTLLTYQNPSGGCSSYERTRGGEYLEMFNAAEVFGRIMVEYDYPECTTAVVTALTLFKKHWPDYRSNEIEVFIQRALGYIKKAQFPDGSWYGSWAVCFTYGTMFALESLASVGETYQNSEYVRKACHFLLSKQREDGGWSESCEGCRQIKYIEHPSGSQVVQTAYTVIGLLSAEYPDMKPIEKAIRLIMARQQPNGEWLQEAIEGMFNKTCAISYPNYKFTFTMLALGKFARMYPNYRLD
ncbi:terpenoid cyclases/protein prenyltransferase alpha-alpha toroid [Aspergillus transmontanensis]|uniref:Terpene cyclase/mutase family member n=1 Tax=Aspergillus transmontanensis TaxID=1034304 RepID=A0A5N6W4M4_9EURO|nr:terpenoid cyclases/protein prenyltransferase alpha-alpha toroid [Aspergillus transmontanensis]